jgi:putative inorganic carbon (hco3(-)) transporter
VSELRSASSFDGVPTAVTTLAVVGGVAAGTLVTADASPVVAAGLIAVPLLLGIIARPQLGLYLLVFLAYARVSDVLIEFHGAPSLLQPFLAFLLLVLATRWLLYAERPTGLAQPAWLLGGYGMVLSLSLFHARDAERAWEVVAAYGRDGLIVLIIVALLRTARALRGVVWTLISVGVLLGTISVYQYLSGDLANDFGGFGQTEVLHIFGSVEDYRVSGPIADPNYYAQFLLVLVPLALGRLRFETSWWRRTVALWALLVVTGAIVFTFSRGALLTFVVVVALAFVLQRPRPITLLAVAVTVAVSLPLLPAGYAERVTNLMAAGPGGARLGEASLQGRASALNVGLHMVADRPLLGVGIAQFPEYYREYARPLGLDASRTAVEPHNLYVQMAAETGLVGLLAFGVVLWVALRNIVRVRDSLRRKGAHDLAGMVGDLGLGLLAYLVAGLFLHNAYPRFLWVLVGIALALPSLDAVRSAQSHPRESVLPAAGGTRP